MASSRQTQANSEPRAVHGDRPDADATTPSLNDLSPTGEGQAVLTQGMTMALTALIARLRMRRIELGLSLTDVARRSRLTIATLGRLESLQDRNPTLDSVFRYGLAIGALVTMDFEEVEPMPEEDETEDAEGVTRE